MKSKQAINTEKAPKALPGIYNQAIVANGTAYCSGSIGMNPSTGEMVKGDIQDRTVCSWPQAATQQSLLYRYQGHLTNRFKPAVASNHGEPDMRS